MAHEAAGVNGMIDALTGKSDRLRDVIDRLICAVGPDRLQVVINAEADAESVFVVSRRDPLHAVFVSVAEMEPDRYSATYDRLHTKPSGDATSRAPPVPTWPSAGSAGW